MSGYITKRNYHFTFTSVHLSLCERLINGKTFICFKTSFELRFEPFLCLNESVREKIGFFEIENLLKSVFYI